MPHEEGKEPGLVELERFTRFHSCYELWVRMAI